MIRRKLFSSEVASDKGMVASAEPIASAVGAEILKAGGNAVDAAVAVGFALAVTYPAAGNLGGGGFMMIRMADGKATSIDYREIAPMKATRDIFLDKLGKPIDGEGGSLRGYRAAGVPGTVAGLFHAFYRYGSKKLSWADVIAPAQALAAKGFPVPAGLADSLKASTELLKANKESKRVYLNDGNPVREGQTFLQPDLAATLARLQKSGWRDFYNGETARLIVDDIKRNKGLISAADLDLYVAKERLPLQTSYRGRRILSMPPPSSGGVALAQMLGMLEGFDMLSMDSMSPKRYHLLLEVMRRAFADRAEYLGDPDFTQIPITRLLDREYLASRRNSITPDKASDSQTIKAGMPGAAENWETTHFTVVDAAGNAVANTYTLNGSYGSGVTVPGTGILLNNEMDDFAIKPGTPNMFGLIQSDRNAIGPRRRPLSSMTPTFVLTPDGSNLHLAIGSPGGPTIINTVLQVILNVVDHNLPLQEAIDAPRVHHQWLPDEVMYEPQGIPDATLGTLKQYGHKLTEKPRRMGDAQGILIDPKTKFRIGASDPRGYGKPAGY